MVECDGLYDVSVHKMLSESELKPETVFECLLTIPGTAYAAREETMYFPGKGKNHFIDCYIVTYVLFFFITSELGPCLVYKGFRHNLGKE